MARHVEGPWFRKQKDGWYATVAGKNVSLGVRGEDNAAEAKRAWHRLMASAPLPSAPKPVAPDEMTVGAVVDAFLTDAAARLKATTVTMYGVYLARFKSSFGGKRVSELLPVDVHKWMLKMGKCGTTHGIALRSASACLGWAVRNDIMASNPARKVPKPKSKSRSADAVITEADHRKLLEAADPEFRTVLTVLHGTGCRSGEAAAFAVDNFDAANGVVKLFVHKSDKTGKPRLIFLPPDVCEMLKTQAARYTSGALLRSNKGFAWTGRSITEAMRRLHKKTGVRCIAYGYRHGFATTALSRGIPDAQVAALLGHTSTAVLHAHYSHLTSQASVLREALDKMKS